MVKTVIINLDLLKTSGLDCILMVVLKKCEPNLSYILAELFNKCPKESCFPDSWKVYQWSLYSVFKGYLRYETIMSQNVSSEAQSKNFLIC